MPVSADLVSYKFSVEQDNIMSKTIKEFPKKKAVVISSVPFSSNDWLAAGV